MNFIKILALSALVILSSLYSISGHDPGPCPKQAVSKKLHCNNNGERIFSISRKLLQNGRCVNATTFRTEKDPSCLHLCSGFSTKTHPCENGLQTVHHIQHTLKSNSCNQRVLRRSVEQCGLCRTNEAGVLKSRCIGHGKREMTINIVLHTKKGGCSKIRSQFTIPDSKCQEVECNQGVTVKRGGCNGKFEVVEHFREKRVGQICLQQLVSYFTERCHGCAGVGTAKSQCLGGRRFEVKYHRHMIKGHCVRQYVSGRQATCSMDGECSGIVIKKYDCIYGKRRIEQLKMEFVDQQCESTVLSSIQADCDDTQKAFCVGKGVVKSKCVDGYQMSYLYERNFVNGECVRILGATKKIYCQDDLNQALCEERSETRGSCTVHGRRRIHQVQFTKAESGDCVEKRTTITRFDSTCVKNCQGAFSLRLPCVGKFRRIKHYRTRVSNGKCTKVAECVRRVRCQPCNDYIVLRGDCVSHGRRIHYIAKFLYVDGNCQPVHKEIVRFDRTCLNICAGTLAESSPCKDGIKTTVTYNMKEQKGRCERIPIHIRAEVCDQCENRKETDGKCLANGIRQVTMTDGVRTYDGDCIRFRRVGKRQSVTCLRPCSGRHQRTLPCDGSRQRAVKQTYQLLMVKGVCVKKLILSAPVFTCDGETVTCPPNEIIRGQCFGRTGLRHQVFIKYEKSERSGECKRLVYLYSKLDSSCPSVECQGEEEQKSPCVDGQRKITAFRRRLTSGGQCTLVQSHQRLVNCSVCGDSTITFGRCNEKGERQIEETSYILVDGECKKLEEVRMEASVACLRSCGGTVEEREPCNPKTYRQAVYKYLLKSVDGECQRELISVYVENCVFPQNCNKVAVVKGDCSPTVNGYRVNTRVVSAVSGNGQCKTRKFTVHEFDLKCIKVCEGRITKIGICVNGSHIEIVSELRRQSSGFCEPVVVDQFKTGCLQCGDKKITIGKCLPNGLREERVSESQLINGQCEEVQRIQYSRSIACRRPCEGNATEEGECDPKKEWMPVTVYNLNRINGLCVAKKVGFSLEPCVPRVECAQKSVVNGLCLNEKGARQVFEMDWVYKNNICHQIVTKKQVFDMECLTSCFGTGKISESCKGSKQVQTNYKLQMKNGKCSKTLVSIDMVDCLETPHTPPNDCQGSRVVARNCNPYSQRQFLRISKVYEDGKCLELQQTYTKFDKSCRVYCDGVIEQAEPCYGTRMHVNVYRWMRFEGNCRLVKEKSKVKPCQPCAGSITTKGKCAARGLRFHYTYKKVQSHSRCITRYYVNKVHDASCKAPAPCSRQREVITSRCVDGKVKVTEVRHVERRGECVRQVVSRGSLVCNVCVQYSIEPGACAENGIRRYYIRREERVNHRCVPKFETKDEFDDTCTSECVGTYTKQSSCANGLMTVTTFKLTAIQGQCIKVTQSIQKVACNACIGSFFIKGLCSVRGKREYYSITMGKDKYGQCVPKRRTTEIEDELCLPYCQGVHTERGKCVNDERLVTFHRYNLINGQCVINTRKELHPCDICYGMTFLRGECNDKGQRAYLKIKHVKNENGACVPVEKLVFQDTESCIEVCKERVTERQPCGPNKKQKVTDFAQEFVDSKCVRWKVGEREEACETPVPEKCQQTVTEKKGCNKFGERLFIATHSYLEGADCRKHQSLYTKFDPTCFRRCEGGTFEKKGKCIKGWQRVQTMKFISDLGRCRPVPIKIEKQKCSPCQGQRIVRGPCKDEEKRLWYITTFKHVQGWCIKKQLEKERKTSTCKSKCSGVAAERITCRRSCGKYQTVKIFKQQRNLQGECIRILGNIYKAPCQPKTPGAITTPTIPTSPTIPGSRHPSPVTTKKVPQPPRPPLRCQGRMIQRGQCHPRLRRREVVIITFARRGPRCLRKRVVKVETCKPSPVTTIRVPRPQSSRVTRVPVPPERCEGGRARRGQCHPRVRQREVVIITYVRRGRKCFRKRVVKVESCTPVTRKPPVFTDEPDYPTPEPPVVEPTDEPPVTEGEKEIEDPVTPPRRCRGTRTRRGKCHRRLRRRFVVRITRFRRGQRCFIRRVVRGIACTPSPVTTIRVPRPQSSRVTRVPVPPERCEGGRARRGQCHPRVRQREVVIITYVRRGRKCFRKRVVKVESCSLSTKRPSVIVTDGPPPDDIEVIPSSETPIQHKCTGKVEMESADMLSLNLDASSRHRHLISSFKFPRQSDCARRCLQDSRCLSATVLVNVDIFECTLWSIRPCHSKLRKPFKVNMDSTLMVKKCKHSCRPTEVVKRRPCRCKRVSGMVVCFRQYTLLMSRNNASGECHRKEIRVSVPCKHDCADNVARRTCRKYRLNRKCRVGRVQKHCPYTCGVKKCQCQGSVTWEDDCKDGQRAIVKLEHRKRFGLCTMFITRRQRKCQVRATKQCSPLQHRDDNVVVFPCIGGSRYVMRVSYENEDGVCKRRVNKYIRNCQGCPTCQDEEFTRCLNGRRQRIKYWYNRANDCCKREKHVEDFPCSSCPEDIVVKSECLMGLKIVRRYVWYSVDGQCVSQTIARLERCF